jgi:predicted O-linked N-acetylglucosamine transferase (SPINDLY family)
MNTNELKHLFNDGFRLHEQGKLDKAKLIYEKILNFYPDDFDSLHLLGVIESRLSNFAIAIELISRAISVNPNNAAAYLNLGNIFKETGVLIKALTHYEKSIELKKDFAEAHSNRGNVLVELGRIEEALVSYDQAVSINPNYAVAYYNRGNALLTLNMALAAIGSYESAIKNKPDYASAFYNRGNALLQLKRTQEAAESYRSAINFKSNYSEAYYNLGTTQSILKNYIEAKEFFEKALFLQKDYDFLNGTLLHTKQQMCDWSEFENSRIEIANKLRENKKVSLPFPILSLFNSLELQHRVSKIWVQNMQPSTNSLELLQNKVNRLKKDKIKVAYYSADFYNHATLFLMAELFENHDKQKFEIIGFNFSPNKKDELQQRISKYFDNFIDINNFTDKQVSEISRELNIDIAVDLKGYTKNSREGIFSYRCAPIQISYLGYPGTMGAEYIDYIVADRIVIPEESQKYYNEKIIYLPDCYQVNDSKRKISNITFTKKEFGLPENSFVFCSFNNNYKILPSTFDIWMRIIQKVDGSVLWLFEDNPTAATNLRSEAEKRGVETSRLIFAKPMKLEDHLARHKLADLFLDTFPYNAHTTASDALWAGLPLITLAGETFASRVAASLLSTLELEELITYSENEYESLAICLAKNRKKLKSIKIKLDVNKKTSSLFSGKSFVKKLEEAYFKIHENYINGFPSKNFYIEGISKVPFNLKKNDEINLNSMRKAKLPNSMATKNIELNHGTKVIEDRIFYKSCPLCHSFNHTHQITVNCSKHSLFDHRLNNYINWRVCSDCEHSFTDGYYSKAAGNILYGKTQDTQMVGYQIEDNRLISARMIEKILPFSSTGVWLDVGFGNGSLLLTAHEFGFHPIGLDIREENVKLLSNLGISAYNKNITEININPLCSVISMCDVLEHIPYPKRWRLFIFKYAK